MTDKKTVGVKQFQANLASSFPKEKGEVTTITKRNIPMYEVSCLSMEGGGGAGSTLKICNACGQEIKEERIPSADSFSDKEEER